MRMHHMSSDSTRTNSNYSYTCTENTLHLHSMPLIRTYRRYPHDTAAIRSRNLRRTQTLEMGSHAVVLRDDLTTHTQVGSDSRWVQT